MSILRTVESRHQAIRSPLASLAAAIRQLCRAYVTWRMEESAIAVLQSMTDQQLLDIGLSRSDITRAVRRSRAPVDHAPGREH